MVQFVARKRVALAPPGSLGWRHALGDAITIVNSFTNGGPFTVAGAPIAADVAVVEASAVPHLNQSTSLLLGYDGLLDSGLGSEAVTATLSGKF